MNKLNNNTDNKNYINDETAYVPVIIRAVKGHGRFSKYYEKVVWKKA